MYYVYMLHCYNSSRDIIYTGYTSDIRQRIKQHKGGRGGRTTKAFANLDSTIELVYFEMFKSKGQAKKRERKIKKHSRLWKNSLIREFQKGMDLVEEF